MRKLLTIMLATVLIAGSAIAQDTASTQWQGLIAGTRWSDNVGWSAVSGVGLRVYEHFYTVMTGQVGDSVNSFAVQPMILFGDGAVQLGLLGGVGSDFVPAGEADLRQYFTASTGAVLVVALNQVWPVLGDSYLAFGYEWKDALQKDAAYEQSNSFTIAYSYGITLGD